MTEINEYKFETKQILNTLQSWVKVESPTFDKNAVNRMMDLCSNFLAEMGGRLERIPGKNNLGQYLIKIRKNLLYYKINLTVIKIF